MGARTVTVKESVLAVNNRVASATRERLNRSGILMINVMSSPGSGKTSLIVQTVRKFKYMVRIAVIEGDIASSVDSDRISREGVAAVQINTGGGCHLDASMVQKAFDKLNLESTDLVFIENVGNLVCTADFDLGAHRNVVILSVPEGDDKPYKYPVMFSESDVVLVNKTDVLPYFDFNLAGFTGIIEGMNPSARIFRVSAKTGDGMDSWYSWIEEEIDRKRQDKE